MTEDMFGGPQVSDVTIEDQIACVERELGYRHRVYTRLVAEGRMRQAQADHEILSMQAVLATLRGVER